MLPAISSHFANKTVLVTGVTGFVGLALVEKLLRSVPNIGTIYVLVRAKRGKTAETRVQEIKDDLIFETLKSTNNNLEKLKGVAGNLEEDNLGLSPDMLAVVTNTVEYVFHCAATLDFEASLKTTVEVNVLGTKNIVELCKKMDKLKALVHVSSAYANANRKAADEVLYPPPEDVTKVVELVQTLSPPHLDEITPKLLKEHPNTYTFTKALAEHEVANAFREVPSAIVRPSMIVGAWKEPVPGWTNSKNGPQGFIMGAAAGVVRRLPVGKHLVYDYIPVDVVINTMIAAAVYTDINKDTLSAPPIFHCTTSVQRPFRWSEVENDVSHLLHKYPLVQAAWYPHLKLLPSVWRFRLSAIIFHMIPAYIFDTLARVTGQRPRLVKLHTAVNQSLDRLEPFIFQEWKFTNGKSVQLHKSLQVADRTNFGLDVETLEWPPFFEDMAKGVRRYLHKEKEHTLGKARSKNAKLKLANYGVQVLLFALIWLLVHLFTGLPWLQSAYVLPTFFILYCWL